MTFKKKTKTKHWRKDIYMKGHLHEITFPNISLLADVFTWI